MSVQPETTKTEDSECEERILWRWRWSWATRLGFDEPRADLIASAPSTEIDLHELEWLCRRGCPPALALEIVL